MDISIDQPPFSLLRQGVPLDTELTDSSTSTIISCALELQADHHTCLASSRSWNCRLWSSDLHGKCFNHRAISPFPHSNSFLILKTKLVFHGF